MTVFTQLRSEFKKLLFHIDVSRMVKVVHAVRRSADDLEQGNNRHVAKAHVLREAVADCVFFNVGNVIYCSFCCHSIVEDHVELEKKQISFSKVEIRQT